MKAGTYTLGFKATGVLKRTGFGVSKDAPMVSDDLASGRLVRLLPDWAASMR